MEVILLERIEKLGQMGDVVNVRPGFARNYLLPQKKALRATTENRNYFETQRAQLETTNLELKKEADAVSQKLDGLSVTIVRQASDNDQLYGSVTVRNIAQAITEAGFTIDSKQVQMARPIKTVGMHEIIVKLHPEVSVNITANVARSEEEAISQVEEESNEMTEKLGSSLEENTTSQEEETIASSTEEETASSE
ncbi:MAG: 50S ribosomal protein L9 [Pseudomonadota bacterium]|nr:50S ribosomal protein L9 [Pseudomonadota bacterium]